MLGRWPFVDTSEKSQVQDVKCWRPLGRHPSVGQSRSNGLRPDRTYASASKESWQPRAPPRPTTGVTSAPRLEKTSQK
eukprot:8624230-Alexandrium_andersonii.AAC.1